MNKFYILIVSLIFSVSAFAYNFTGKTFKGIYEEDGRELGTITFAFKANNKCSSTLTVRGQGTKHGTLLWEVSGDFINLYEPATGDYMYLEIYKDCDDDGDCVDCLLIKDDYGNVAMMLYEVKTSTKKSSTKKSSGKKKR